MSALFGELSPHLKLFDSLAKKQDAIWENRAIETVRSGGAAIGLLQHTSFFPLGSPIFAQDRNRIYALHGYIWQGDGFPLSSQDARKAIVDAGDRLIEKGDPLGSAGGGVFTLVVIDISAKKVWIANDLSGILPLYYSVSKNNFLFSSHSRPLAQVLNSRLDRIGVVQTAAFHYSIGSRTLFKGIGQLRPGEVLTYSLESNTLDRKQTTRMYGPLDSYSSDNEAADALWHEYMLGMKELSKPAGKNGVLLSGGFDTRLVVRGFLEFKKEIAGVTFGEEDNHEVSTAKKVAALAMASTIVHSPVEDCHPPYERVTALINQAESANFAYCETGASMLKAQGVVSVSTGYGGEAFIGGQALQMMPGTWGNRNRLRFAVKRSVGLPTSTFSIPVTSHSLDELREDILSFHNRSLNRIRKLLTPEWQLYIEEVSTHLKEDVDTELRRYMYSHPETMQQVCERFWLEHHVLKRFGRQEVTIMTKVPSVLPTILPRFLQRCTNLNPSRKVDHGIYVKMVKRHFGRFASLPTSNIPVPLTSPGLVQWIARAVRARNDQKSIYELVRSRGTQRGRRAGWAEFEGWMRRGPFLNDIRNMVDGTLYSTDAIGAKAKRVLDWEERVYSGQEFLTPVTISGMTRRFTV